MKYILVSFSLLVLTNCGGATPLPSFSEDDFSNVTQPNENSSADIQRGGNLTALVLGTQSTTASSVVNTINVTKSVAETVNIFGTSVPAQNGVQLIGGMLDTSYRHVATTGEFIYTITGIEYDSAALVGITTHSSDIPRSGSAQFVGTAQAVLDTNLGSFEMVNGQAQISANFASQLTTANVTLSNFEINSTSLTNAATPVDEIRITNLTGLRGATLNGGHAQFYLDGQRQTTLGEVMTEDSTAAFFGVETGQPAEFGGVHAATFQNGSVEVIYSGK